MKQLLKTTALATAVAATMLTAVPAANANPAVGWAIAGGVAVGALVVAAIAHPGWGGTAYAAGPAYGATEPLYAPNYTGTAPLYAPNYARTALYGPGYVTTALAAGSPEWYRYCENRYRTFNPQTGYFIDSTGQPHFCGR